MPGPVLTIPDEQMRQALLPHIVDPIHDGAADPCVFWNDRTEEWWCVFVQRRANTATLRPDWNGRCHGTTVAVASGGADGRRWVYRGSLDLESGWRHDTFWGPDVIRDDEGRFHMFVTHIDGVPEDDAWDTFGRPSRSHRRIRRYVSSDAETWILDQTLALGTDWAVDPTVARLPGGGWGLWFKAEAEGGAVWFTESSDLRTWSPPVDAVGGWHEGPDVFVLGGWMWLIAETRDPGFAVYRSTDGRSWEARASLDLSAGNGRPARAPNVLVLGQDHAVLAFYVQAPTDSFGADVPTSGRASVSHLVRLTTDGTDLQLDLFGDDLPLSLPANTM